eukprot:TRINITY_DN3978_c0_g1_i2.p1 TRINITY_DN3978_c0_g1~~TRINITY_DN3978_c0_g1_i2.p1  ORF type:complete len:199 (-),score=13.45 TRINITY_DN3978_c0_g1_i2:30-626(-)
MLTFLIDFFQLDVTLYIFMAILCLFHVSEALHAFLYNRETFGIHSFLLSIPFVSTLSICTLEYFIERFFFPAMKESMIIFSVGLLICLSGEALRKGAMFFAMHNFSHDVKTSQRDNHVLVNTGVYKHIRHPGYCGWFWWVVGTQIMMANPLGVILCAVLAFIFFNDRIPYEEEHLIEFFGFEYVKYRAVTPTYIPFIQ